MDIDGDGNTASVRGQICIDLFRGLSGPARSIWPPALLYISVLVWALIQTIPGIFPGWSHSVWVLVPDIPATISADPIESRHHVLRLATYGMIFWIALRTAERADLGLTMLKAIALFSTALAVYGLCAFWTGINPLLGDAVEGARVTASFENRNSYATYAVFGLIANLAVYMHLSKGNSGELSARAARDFLENFFGSTWIYALGILLCLTAIVFSQSRAGTAAAIISLVTYAVAYRRRGQRLNPLLLATVLGIIGFVGVSLTSDLLTRLLATSTESIRFVAYPAIVDGLADRPWLGHGLGAFHDTFRTYLPMELSQLEFALAHNSYLENAWELGLPAAGVLYIALFWIAAVIARGTIVRRRHRSFACVALAILAGAGFHSLFDFSLQMPATASLFAILLGFGWAQSFPRRKENA